MRKYAAALLAGLPLLLSPVASSQAQAKVQSEAGRPAEMAGLLAAEDARFHAQIARDAEAVARGMADECLYTHATGRIQTKKDYIAALAGGFAPRAITTQDRTARVFGKVGVVHGIRIATMGERSMTDSYLAVYVRRDGRWQLLAWQTSPPPPAPGQAPGGPGAPQVGTPPSPSSH